MNRNYIYHKLMCLDKVDEFLMQKYVHHKIKYVVWHNEDEVFFTGWYDDLCEYAKGLGFKRVQISLKTRECFVYAKHKYTYKRLYESKLMKYLDSTITIQEDSPR